jgi:hypothetical protein
VAAPFGVLVSLLQVGAQQREQRSVALGEIRSGIAEKGQSHRPFRPGGQAQPERVLQA